MLQKGAAGEVIGVLSQGIYARMGEDILLFHDAKWGEVPFGIAVSDIGEFAKAMQPELADTVILSDTEIHIGDRAMSYCLCGPRTVPSTYLIPPTKEKLRAIYAYVSEHGAHGGMLELLETNRGGARDAVDALLTGDADAARKLIGLGRGLTPSGDDFLCGFLTILSEVDHPLAEKVKKVIAANLHRTTDISAAYLQSVLKDEYFTIYGDVGFALFWEDPFAPYCDFVLAMGASSGTDTLLGALAAAKLLL